MPEIKTTDYILPACWASYLINGDASGMSDEEQEACDAWLADTDPGFCTDVGESEFSWRNDVNCMGGDVATFTFIDPE